MAGEARKSRSCVPVVHPIDLPEGYRARQGGSPETRSRRQDGAPLTGSIGLTPGRRDGRRGPHLQEVSTTNPKIRETELDIRWTKDKLENYMFEFDKADRDERYNWLQADSLNRLTPTVLRILDTINERTVIVAEIEYDGFRQIKSAAARGLGILDDWHEVRERLKPDTPTLDADQLHPWIWEAAETFWQSKHYRTAVQVAATALNAQVQAKVERRDISDDKLISRCFSENPPDPQNPRLRIRGDQNHPTTQSLQRGAGQLGLACFWAIRNPATHETDEWSEADALEKLAVLSALARMIDGAEVVTG